MTASQFLNNGGHKTALVVGADALTRWVDWSDRNTCVLFGDGAGAMVLTSTETAEEDGILGFEMHSDGKGYCNLQLPYQQSDRAVGPDHHVLEGDYEPISMNGKEVYKFATREVPEVIEEALANAGLTTADVDHLLLHQANIRIMEIVAQRLGIPMEKVRVCVRARVRVRMPWTRPTVAGSLSVSGSDAVCACTQCQQHQHRHIHDTGHGHALDWAWEGDGYALLRIVKASEQACCAMSGCACVPTASCPKEPARSQCS